MASITHAQLKHHSGILSGMVAGARAVSEQEEAMPRPTPPLVDLRSPEQQGLDALVRRHTAPQQVHGRTV